MHLPITSRLAVRNLRASMARFALTVLAVVLGVGFVAATMVLTGGISRSVDDADPTPGDDADVVVRMSRPFTGQSGAPSAGSTPPVSDDLLDLVDEVPGVRGAHGAVIGTVAVIGRDGELVPAQGGQSQLGVSWSGASGPTAAFVAGRAPRGAGEVVIDRTTAQEAGYDLGEEVTLIARGQTTTARLVGIFDAGALSGRTVAGFAPAVAQQLLVSPGHWSYITVTGNDDVSQRTLRDRIDAALPAGVEAITGAEHAEELASGAQRFAQSIQALLYTFAGVAIVVGAFIIFNTFSIVVAQRTRALALLRAVGTSRRQVTTVVMAEAAGVGVIGALAGLVVGLIFALVLRALLGLAGMDVSATALSLSPSTALWACAVGMGSTIIATYVPARRAAGVAPVAVLRREPTTASGPTRFRQIAGVALTGFGLIIAAAGTVMPPPAVTLLGLVLVFFGLVMLAPVLTGPVISTLASALPALFGATGRLAKDNAQRDPRRSAATALALMIGLALVSAVTVLNASALTSIDRAINRVLGADYMVISQLTDGIETAATDALQDVPGVISATPVGYGSVQIDGQVVDVVAGDPKGLADAARLSLRSGDLQGVGDGIMIDSGTAARLGWNVGTSVSVVFPDGRRARLQVEGVYRDNQLLGPFVLGPDQYRQHFTDQMAGLIYVDVATPDTQTQREISDALSPWPQLEVLNQEAIRGQNRQSVSQFVTLLIGLLALSVIIAALGITNTLALSVIERTREIGLLRAVGMTRQQLRRTIRLEAITVALFGAVLGISVGVLLGMALQQAMATRGINVLVVPMWQLAGYIVLAVVIAVLAAEWPARRASRMDVLSAINAP